MLPWVALRQERLRQMADECRTVLDFGQSAREDGKLFSRCEYVTCDIDESTGPDIVADICDLNMVADASIDGVVCIAVLEHVYDPFGAIAEIHRILRPGEPFFGYVPFLYSYHAKPGSYEDYWRFSRAGIDQLLKAFTAVEITSVRGNATTIVNLLPRPLNRLQGYLHWLDGRFSGKQVSGHYFFCRRKS